MKTFDKIYFHADDYGITLEQAERILLCKEQGVLNSISIIPNTLQMEECRCLLNSYDNENDIRRVLHLNFVEGKPIAEKQKVSMLVDEKGYFCLSFGQLLKASYWYGKQQKRELKNQLKTEISAQIDEVRIKHNYHISAIDSHQHYHMIPIVQEALLEVIKETALNVKEIRVPVDPLMPLIRTPKLWLQVPPINWIKWCVLRIYAGKTRRHFSKYGIDSPIFFGILFTCQMKKEVVEILFPKYKAYAKKKGKSLELMFHPGNLLERSQLLDVRSKQLERFYMSENRILEAECLKWLRNGVLRV